MSSREVILNSIQNSLKGRNFQHLNPRYRSPMKITENSLLDEYIKNQMANKSEVINSNDVTKTLKEILQKINAKNIIANADLPVNIEQLEGNYKIQSYKKSVDEFRDELFDIDTSIVLARCGVANLGIVGLSSNEFAPRLSSLVTNSCIYLLSKENIVENIYLGIELMKNYEKKRTNSEILPSNLIFVAGPSRTADIELQTVFGVHGPRETFVILY